MLVLKLVLECTAHECVVGNPRCRRPSTGVRLPGWFVLHLPTPIPFVPASRTFNSWQAPRDTLSPASPLSFFVPGPPAPRVSGPWAGTQFKFVPAHAVRGW